MQLSSETRATPRSRTSRPSLLLATLAGAFITLSIIGLYFASAKASYPVDIKQHTEEIEVV